MVDSLDRVDRVDRVSEPTPPPVQKQTFVEWLQHVWAKDSKVVWTGLLLLGGVLGWATPDSVSLPKLELPTVNVRVVNFNDLGIVEEPAPAPTSPGPNNPVETPKPNVDVKVGGEIPIR